MVDVGAEGPCGNPGRSAKPVGVLTPTLREVREVLEEVDGTRLSAPRLGRRLHCSESTLQRRLREQGTSLVAERNKIRASRAFALLGEPYPVSQAARRVGVSTDHLRAIILSVYRWTPAKIKRAAELAAALETEPCTRSKLAAAQRRDQMLQRHLAEIGADHPLASWAKGLVLRGYHPERESAAFAKELRERERAAYLEKRERSEAEVVMSLSVEELDEIDVEHLLVQREYETERVHWRANQLRHQRAGTASR
jgi:AraC-like DNA-binding protein